MGTWILASTTALQLDSGQATFPGLSLLSKRGLDLYILPSPFLLVKAITLECWMYQDQVQWLTLSVSPPEGWYPSTQLPRATSFQKTKPQASEQD
jgi:hypothetical protein